MSKVKTRGLDSETSTENVNVVNAPHVVVDNMIPAVETGLAKDASIGSLTETAPATDTASSGLNGRLQRIAQRITSLIGFFRLGQGTMAQSLAVTIASDQSVIKNMDYLTAISLGLFPNKFIINKIGFTSTVGTTKSDLWGVGTASEYVFPTAGIQMSINSGGNAQDAGVAAYTGIATGGSTTSLIDTGKDFTTLPVVAGDVVIIQNGAEVEWAYVTSLTGTTQINFSAGFSSGGNPTGLAYSVIDKSAGGTGIQVVMIRYLNASYAVMETYIVLNGVSAVNSTPTDIYRVNNFHAIVAGQTSSGASAAANINLVDTATKTINYAIISAGWAQSQQAIFTIPVTAIDGTTITKGVLTQWQAGCAKATGTPVVSIRLRTTSHEGDYLQGIWHTQDITTDVNGNIEILMPINIRLSPRTDIKITAISDAASTTCSGGFKGWYE